MSKENQAGTIKEPWAEGQNMIAVERDEEGRAVEITHKKVARGGKRHMLTLKERAMRRRLLRAQGLEI